MKKESRSPEEIILVVCASLNQAVEEIRSHKRDRKYSTPRHLAMYFIKEQYPRMPLKEIGELFEDRDHSTVSYAIKTVRGLMERNKEYKRKFTEIKQELIIEP